MSGSNCCFLKCIQNSQEAGSVQFSSSGMSDFLQPHGLQDTSPPCPSPTPRVYPNSCPSSRWCHSTISSSVVPFSSCPQSFPASVCSNVSALCIRWPKYWSFSFSISPSNGYSRLISFRMDWLDLLAVQGAVKSLFRHHSSKRQFLGTQLSFCAFGLGLSHGLWPSFILCFHGNLILPSFTCFSCPELWEIAKFCQPKHPSIPVQKRENIIYSWVCISDHTQAGNLWELAGSARNFTHVDAVE